jgi:hypothetical protein
MWHIERTHNLDLAVIQSILVSLRRLPEHRLCLLAVACRVFEVLSKVKQLSGGKFSGWMLATLVQTHGTIPHALEALQRVVKSGSGSHLSGWLSVFEVLQL